MRIILLRHAETEGNLLKRYVGSSDEDLSLAGLERAHVLSAHNEISTVYTSTRKRTQQTAHILYPQAQLVPCPGLDEMDFGLFEQKHWQDLEHDAAYQRWVDSGCELACPKGESKSDFTKRCVESFLPLLAHEASLGASDLHLVVHGGTIMALLSELATPVLPYFEWKADFCGGYEFEYLDSNSNDRPLKLLRAIRPKT